MEMSYFIACWLNCFYQFPDTQCSQAKKLCQKSQSQKIYLSRFVVHLQKKLFVLERLLDLPILAWGVLWIGQRRLNLTKKKKKNLLKHSPIVEFEPKRKYILTGPYFFFAFLISRHAWHHLNSDGQTLEVWNRLCVFVGLFVLV